MNAVPRCLVLYTLIVAASRLCAGQATVQVDPAAPQGPRPLQDETRAGVIRDYLESWHNFSAALNQNRPDLLNANFIGTAKDKLTEAIKQQQALGIRTQYQDVSHNIRIVFYSPEGLSIQLTDDVQYDVQLFDHDKALIKQRVSAHYIAVLTPAEVRWRVRVFQSSE